MKYLKNTIVVLILNFILVLPSFAQFLQSEERDLELTRRENAVSGSIQTQLEEVLSKYYEKETFLININAYLERLSINDVQKKPVEKDVMEETELPGLPIQPSEISGQQIEKFVIDKWVFSDKFKIKYLDILILLDDKAFQPKDMDFVKTVVKARAGIDWNRGDMLTVKTIPFPPPVNAAEIYKEARIQEAQKGGLLKELYPYLYFGGTVVAFLLFLIIVLQIINLVKSKRHSDVSPYGYQLPPKNQFNPTLPQADIASQMPIPQPVQSPSGEGKDMFYELRQLMVTTLIGNPKLASEVFKRWVELEQDNGIYQIAGFLKATDPKLVDLLSDHLGKEVSSKVHFAMNQMTSVDKESVIETLKKFREEFQKEQSIRPGRNASEDLFEFLKQLSPEQIYHVIKDEPESIMAIALAQVSPQKANEIFKELPIEKQSRIPVEIGKLKKIPASSYQDIADKLAKKAMEVKKIKYVTTDGVDALGNLLEQSPPDKEHEILASIQLHDIQLADELRKVYITFDEIPKLPDKTLSEILRSFDREIITRALIDTSESLKSKILKNLPQRMQIMIGDDVKRLEESGEIPIEEVQKARRTITQKIREMAKSGLIDLKKMFSSGNFDNY
ncbi:MAG: hypothetical protein JW871_02950 [Endomicrobiales bacterium]|nr:hypothetical protein [Endomicrobiales bacterium]